MGSAHTGSTVAVVEVSGADPRHFAAAARGQLGSAAVVVADPQTHPNVLWEASEAAEFVLRAWDDGAAALVCARADAGAHVVCVAPSASARASAAQDLRALGVQPEVVSGGTSDADAGGSLSGRRILVTRPRPQAQHQRDAFIALGADAVALPCLRVCPPSDPTALPTALRSLPSFDGVIVSSRAGVGALVRSLSEIGLDVGALAGRQIVAVGKATAAACRAEGISPDIVPSRPHSEGIAEAIEARKLLGGRWLHVRAEHGRMTLDQAISNAGGAYTLAPAYRTDRPPAPAGVGAWLRKGVVDAICLHSGRTGTHLRELLGELGPEAEQLLSEATIVSAGPITTKALQEQGFEVASTAASPGDDGMVDAVLGLFAGG